MDPFSAAGVKVAGAAFEHAFKMLADMPNGDSLVGYAQAGTVEPTCLVDDSVRNADLLPDTLQLAQSVFAGYYFRAFSMHNMSIGNSTVKSRLDQFSTRRSMSTAVGNTLGSIASLAMEEFDDRLVVDGETRELPSELQELEDAVKKDLAETEQLATGLEASGSTAYTLKGQQPQGKNTPKSGYGNNLESAVKGAAKNVIECSDSKSQTTFGKSIDIGEPVNSGVGRMINVTIKEGKNEVTVPVLIRINAVYMATSPLVHILSSSSQDISIGQRWKKWRLGGIDFWRDLVFCQDQIDIHKKNIKADKTGVYLQMMQKRRQNSVAAAISGVMSANNASNIVVLSQESVKELELKIYGKLSDFNTRQKIFQQGFAMLMFVIDKQWGTVRMYTRDIPEYTELSERDLRGANKRNGGVDIGDVLTAFRAGSSPRL